MSRLVVERFLEESAVSERIQDGFQVLMLDVRLFGDEVEEVPTEELGLVLQVLESGHCLKNVVRVLAREA